MPSFRREFRMTLQQLLQSEQEEPRRRAVSPLSAAIMPINDRAHRKRPPGLVASRAGQEHRTNKPDLLPAPSFVRMSLRGGGLGLRRGLGYDVATQTCVRGKHAAVAREVSAGRWHEGSESGNQGERLEVHRGGAVGPRLLEVQPHGSFRQRAAAWLQDRRAACPRWRRRAAWPRAGRVSLWALSVRFFPWRPSCGVCGAAIAGVCRSRSAPCSASCAWRERFKREKSTHSTSYCRVRLTSGEARSTP